MVLRKLRDEKVENIKRERKQVEMLEMALRGIEDPVMGDKLSPEDRQRLLTTGGNVRDIGGWAIKILRTRMRVMTASEIADVMYSYAWAIDLKAFRRRVIVAVSAIANLEDEEKRTIVLSGHKADNREVLWALPGWMHDGRLIESYLPWVK